MQTKTIVRSALAVLAFSASCGAAQAGGFSIGQWQLPAPIEGSWEVTITPYDCATGVAGTFSFESFLTFGAAGTLIETTSMPNFQPGQRSAGHGYWERTGRKSYDAVFQAFVQTTAGPYTRGKQRVEMEVAQVDDDHWTATAEVTFRDAAGAKVPPSGCMRAAAVRMP